MKKNNFLNLIWIISVLSLLFLGSCKKDKNTTTDPGFGDVKSDGWRTKIGTEVTVEGYVVAEGGNHLPMLVTSKDKYMVDAIIPEKDYILIERDPDLSNYVVWENYHGKKVKITGILEETLDRSMQASASFLGDKSLAKVRLTDRTKLTVSDSVSLFARPAYVNFCVQYPAICSLLVINGNKTALLYSGGINASKAYYRYWNDLKFMYNTLRANGYSANNIRVVYKAGVGEDTDIPVHYAANPTGFNDAVEYLKARMNSSTKFFFMMNNHGGGNDTYQGIYGNSGEFDANGDDNRAGINDNTDENYCYYNSSAAFIDDTIAAKINRLPMGSMILVAKPCFSGGLIWDLRGPNRVILTSGTEFQVTYPNSPGTFGELTYNFLSAINGKKPDSGTVVNADTNGDGKVSMYEAYMYVKNNESRNEQPQYEDDNDGAGTTTPSSSGFGSTVFL